MSGRPLVSVVILSKNAGSSFCETLDAVRDQRAPFAFEVVVVDSGSIDETAEHAAERGFRVHRIHPAEFDHGQTRNIGASLTRGSFIAFLVQDALPADEHWLDALTESLRLDSSIAGAYGRVLPRSEAHPLLKRSVLAEPNASDEARVQRLDRGERFLDLDPEDRRQRANFNNVSSAIRRDVWVRLPFQRGEFAEDLSFGRAVLEAGMGIAFEPRSVVLHSHAYGPREIFQRTRADGRANREILGRLCIDSVPRALRHAMGQVREDWRFLRSTGLSATSSLRFARRSPALRTAEALGLYVGARRRSVANVGSCSTKPVEEQSLRVLLVVHGFPPETNAGTEIYTIELARELRSRGHEVAIVHRAGARSRPNYSLDVDEWDAFPVYRITNHLEYSGISETYHNEAIEEKFRWVLDRFQPTVVHFQHALHLSTRCLRIARDFGAVVLLTLHDYWFICPKVQLIRPDRTVCRLRRPGLGCVACSSGHSAPIRLGKALTPILGPALRAAVRTYGSLVRRTPKLGHRLLNDAVALDRRTPVILADLAAADLLLAPSPFLRERYVAHGIDSERIVVCRNGIRTERLRSVERTPSSTLRIAFTGSLVWWKGLDVLVSAFNRLPPGKARLDIHADHDSNDSLREYRDRLLREIRVPGVTFHGAFRSEQLASIYREIDVLVVPSLWFENAPLAVQEAFAARVPVIASRLGALATLVRDEVDGLLFAPGSAEDLARVLARLVDEPGLLDRLRSTLPDVKDVDEHVTELLLYYRQFLARRAPATKTGSGAIPRAEIWAPEFRKHEGSIRRQGRELVLLAPTGNGRSGVAYDFVLEHSSIVRIDVETEILEGETNVVLGGLVLWNGGILGELPEHRFQPGDALRRSHSFVLEATAGSNRVWVTNSTTREPDRGRYHLRVRRILVYDANEVAAERRS